ncbi:MAG: diaminopropionate ammonia-lyase [Ruminococcaceae bacterium]|nr:diaminopropionate ammonia-lyase [Oscillospiraceae bacterium]
MKRVKAVFPAKTGPADTSAFAVERAAAAKRFHESIPGYAPTPLCAVEMPGLGSVYVKDESRRFGLNAFKGLGGSYSMARYIGEKLGIPEDELSYQRLRSEKLGELHFVTATDGNHGRGVAWAAAQLGLKSTVYMPKGSAVERLENIRAAGAEAEITALNYDDTVRFAARTAEERGWVLLQDTAWPGYETLPRYIMQGYTTMALEAVQQLPAPPTHVFLQAGVGAMAAAVTGFLAEYYGEQKPKIVLVEPDAADCLYRTALADDGALHIVKGDLATIMAGLACGEPCSIGWPILRSFADAFVSMPDEIAERGMRRLAKAGIVSGESGAATVGLLSALTEEAELGWLREALGLNEQSCVLCFSTEGDTDKENYRKIVYEE